MKMNKRVKLKTEQMIMRTFFVNNIVWRRAWMLAAVVVVVIVVGCASSQERALRKAQTQQAVAEALANRHFRIDVMSMTPLRYSSRMTSSGFFLELKGDTLNSYLPYVGQVYRAPIVSTHQGLNFEEPIIGYRETRPKAHLTRIEVAARTQEDSYYYIIEVFDTGKASIRVRSQFRDAISFDGDMNVY